jgi:hypothetical protein
MVRPAMLRAGYAALGLAFLSLAVSPGLVIAGLGLACLGGLLLAFSRDDIPKWAGVALLAYFVVTALAFFAAQSLTIRLGGDRSHYEPLSPGLGAQLYLYLSEISPFVVAACAVAAAWEREIPARALALGAAGGFVLAAVLTFTLTPHGPNVDAIAASARTQAAIVRALTTLAALAGAAAAAWSAARPEEYG